MLGPDGPRFRTDHPYSPTEGEASLRLRLGGVCATDLELCRGYMGFAGVLGHEFVAELAADCGTMRAGTRVVGEINCPCGRCPTCQQGRSNHCPSRTVLGIVGRDGAFAEQLSLPVANLRVVPEGVSDQAAVFVEPLAAACRILDQVHVRPTDRVIVLGLGRLGQLCARVLALTGAAVCGVSRTRAKRDLLPSGIERCAPGQAQVGADIVVDCTGSSAGLAAAQGLVRPRGQIVLKTTVHDLGEARPTAWVVDELTLVGSRCGPFDAALRLLQAGAVDPTPLITAERGLSEGVAALDLAGQPGAIKVLLRPD